MLNVSMTIVTNERDIPKKVGKIEIIHRKKVAKSRLFIGKKSKNRDFVDE